MLNFLGIMIGNKKKKDEYKVGQIIRNPRSGLRRRITKVEKDKISWLSNDGKKTGKCTRATLKIWLEGKDYYGGKR